MGNYDQLKNAVAAVIYDNGAEYITGDRLQDVLVTIINSVGAGATFAGVALPNTNPGTPDPNMFYLAGKAGTYTNFNVTITKGLWVFTNDGGTWTGTDLQVSMLFATGEDVTETSIAGDITQGASGDLPTVGAVRGALEAEDEKFFNEVAYGDIDDLDGFDEAFAGSESGTPAYYTVYVMVNSHKVKVGTMEIVSDNMAHVVTQVMVTHYVLDENGAITGAHADGDLFRIFRSKKIHGGTLPTDDWTPWSYVNETEWKKIVSGADAVPTAGSTNVVKSGGVAAAIESLETADEAIQGTFFNEVAFEDLGNIKLYIDTLAGSQSGTPAYYTVYKAVGDDKVKVGTLQVISDSSRGVLTQILETHYTLDGSGNLSAVVDDDHTFRIARSVTYSGGLVSLWSPWSYVNGSVVDKAVADAAESLGNVNYLLAGCKGNMFDKNYVRVGKGISAAGGIVDEVGGCISCYYKIPDEAEVLRIDGAVGSYMRLRLTSEPSDDVVNTETPAETNVYVLPLINGSAEVYLPTFRLTYPNLKYFCVNVYRGGDDSGLDDFSIVFSPKTLQDVEKTTTLLEKAVSVTVPVNWRLGVVNAQGEHTTTSGDYYMSDYIPVEQGNVYEVTVSGGYGVRVVSFYTSKSSTGYIENSAIAGAPEDGGIVSKTVRVTAPDGARYMKIVKNTSDDVLPLIPDSAYGARSVGNSNGLLGENVAVNWKKGYIRALDNAIISGTTYEYSDLLEVSAGDSFIVGVGGSNVTVGVLFYNSQQTAIEDGRVVNNNQYRQLLVTAPETARYMRVCHNIADGEYRIYKPSYVFKTAIENKGGTNAGTGRYWLKERMKYGFLDNTKKPCVVFEMDINQVSDRSDNTQAFVDKLKEIGAAPTFLIMPKRFRLDVVVQKMQNYMSQGVEIAIHTEPEDGIGSQNPEPHPTIAQFKTIMEDEVTRDVGGTTVTYPGYIPTFLASGFYPLGLVVSNSQTYTPEGGGYPYGDYLIYAHTLFGGRHGSNISDFINTQATDRMEIKRWQIENHNQTEAEILQDFINAVDYIKQNNGIFVVYCHTYNEAGQSYTLPQTLFESMVEYIKSDVFEQKIVVGTMADVVKYYYDIKEEPYISNYNNFRVSWIDDDFEIYNSATATKDARVVKEICDELGIKCDFAMRPTRRHYIDEHGDDIPYVDINGDSTEDYPVNDDQYIDDAPIGTNVTKSKKQFAQEWQAEGFGFLLHPINPGWQNTDGYQGADFCHISLSKCMSAFDKAGIKYENLLIYPYGAMHDKVFKKKMKQNVFSGVGSGHEDVDAAGSDYNVGTCNPMTMQRLFIRADVSEVEGEERVGVAKYKEIIDRAYAAGAWLIFGSHSWDFRESPVYETIEGEQVLVNGSWTDVKEVIEYANSLSHIRPVGEVLKERRFLLGLYSG